VARKICVVTGSRADYGHLIPVMRAIQEEGGLDLLTIVCGQHLDPRFGNTWEVIEADGFSIDAKVDIGLSEDTPLAMAEAVGRGVTGLAKALDSIHPDIVLVLGDRFEIFAAGSAALLLSIPLAHIHGGEVTEGAIDDAMRHSLTKMAAAHFAATEPYASRIRQMGENPQFVFHTGAPGLDHLGRPDLLERADLGHELNLDLSESFFLITYHAVTLQADSGQAAAKALTEALSCFGDTAMIFTGVNSDPGYSKIRKVIEDFASLNPKRRKSVHSLGQRLYLSAMKNADAVIGNSSSGLIEAPAFGVPTVNIGKRQKGRLQGLSVINCGERTGDIRTALQSAISKDFREICLGAQPPYGRGGASKKIVELLGSLPIEELSIKGFHDII